MNKEQKFDTLDLLYNYKNQLMDDLLTDATIRHLMSDDSGKDLEPEELRSGNKLR